MSKRTADIDDDEEVRALKSGQRPVANVDGDDAQEFEDEFDDEFESEDEILEAGVDGRPDDEREAEERDGWSPLPCPKQEQNRTEQMQQHADHTPSSQLWM